MDSTDKRVRQIVGAEAADWFAAHRTGLTATQRHEFDAWIKASPVHIEEYVEIARIARDLREACGPLASSVDALIARAKADDTDRVVPLWHRVRSGIEGTMASQRWQRATVAIAVLAMAGITVLLLARFGTGTPATAPSAAAALHFETRRGEQATVRLPDNSIVHLNTASVVDVRYGGDERWVELSAGEASFEAVHEARPFRVRAGLADIVDVGTKFDVRLTGASTVVTVVEGHVSIGRAAADTVGAGPLHGGPESQTVLLGPNQQLTVSGSAWPPPPTTVDSERATSWLQHKIAFENEPLEQVAEEFNRYSSRRIEIAAPALRTLKISGTFSTDNPASFIAFLRTLDGVRVEVTPTRIVVLQR